MKIKNNSALGVKFILPLFLISLFVCAILRIVQTVKFIDAVTGFITGGTFLNVILCAILFIVSAVFLATSFLSKDTKNCSLIGNQSKNLGITSLIFALSLMYDWLSCGFSGIAVLFRTDNIQGMRELMSTGSLPLAFQSVFAFFSAIYFFIVSSDFFKGNTKISRFKILALAPVGWAVFRLIHRFIRQISFIEVSDLFFELIMLGMLVMFFMAFAQVNSGIYSDGFSWRLVGFGLSAALFAATMNVPRLLITLFNNAYINPQHPFNFSDFAFAIFALLLVIETIKNIGLFSEDETEEAEENNNEEEVA